jgi:hypothetical protein
MLRPNAYGLDGAGGRDANGFDGAIATAVARNARRYEMPMRSDIGKYR